MAALRILAFVFLIPGLAIVYSARRIVEKYSLHDKVECEYEAEMSDEEIAAYKLNKAVVNLKMIGMLIALPGFILAVIAFR